MLDILEDYCWWYVFNHLFIKFDLNLKGVNMIIVDWMGALRMMNAKNPLMNSTDQGVKSLFSFINHSKLMKYSSKKQIT